MGHNLQPTHGGQPGSKEGREETKLLHYAEGLTKEGRVERIITSPVGWSLTIQTARGEKKSGQVTRK